MRCPLCQKTDTKVTDSRLNTQENSTRRRRECLSCNTRFTTYERMEELWPQIVKKDGRREGFSREKIKIGCTKALQKRSISAKRVESLICAIESKVLDQGEREIPSRKIGQWVMEELHALDKVAYVRFASVYREFQDIEEFVNELHYPNLSATEWNSSP